MIIARIDAGLGNQMTKYALARHLAILNDTELKLDITSFKTFKRHRYGLDHFNIKASLATPQEINKLKTNQLMRKLGLIKPSHIIEKEASVFDESILQLRGDFYVEGYWQVEQYFTGIESIIKDDFTVATELAGRDKDIADHIAQTNSVSLHIRRGDYLDHPEIYNTFGLDYYQRAVEAIAQKFPNPTCFVFSDDMPWVKKNLRLIVPIVYVDHNFANKNYEDIRLMSLCRHNIVANSSFSWWGAWLNNHQDKIVIAPQKLFNNPAQLEHDCIPASWLRM